MRVGGRVSPAGIIHLVCLYVSIELGAGNEYGVPIEIKLWDTGRTPLAHMVDVTNGFGLKVLAEHNFLNDNNIAFSPYGLMGILVALYEGVDGESSYQIQRGMQLPWNRNIMRVGFRDIHRTLKTYFVPEEGFLAGLALNNENVTFNEAYKNILRFYGFDLDNDQLPTLAPTNSTNGTSTMTPGMSTESASNGTTTQPTMTTESLPAREDTSSTQAREETTPNPSAETINDIDIRGPSTTTLNPSSAPNAESTTLPTQQDISTTTIQLTSLTTESSAPTTTETTQQTTTTEAMTTTITTTTLLPTTTETTTAAATTTNSVETETVAPPTSAASTAALTDGTTINNEVEILTTLDMLSTTNELTTGDISTITTTSNTLMTETESTAATVTTTQTEDVTVTTTDMTTLSDMTTTVNESTIETLERRKKSIVDFIFTNPPYIDDYLYYRSYDIPIAADIPSNSFAGQTNFLANGLRNVQVTYMQYDTVLEHAYLPHLEASALRLPLDSDRYYLLVVLPMRGGVPELGRLLSRMARESDLSDVYNALRPRRVRAIVPSFTVRGHVTLTTDLQKLGIRDVFEPRQRDFTPMTPQTGVYVRSIEQAVSVAIRKYRPDDHKKNRYVTNRQQIIFSATYPFLYFVMDSSIHVALMAGKMVDPLNSRIL